MDVSFIIVHLLPTCTCLVIGIYLPGSND